jgi:phosphopantetheinyl transferase
MPHEKIEYHQDRVCGLWKITESEESLLRLVRDYETISDQITHSQKRLEFVTGRVLAKMLAEKLDVTFQGVTKDEHGKPFYLASSIHLSLSHSFPYVAALADTSKSVGIDVEQIKSKLLRIAPRILHTQELENSGANETKLCVYWCAKEALVKVYGKKDLVFAEHLWISPFQLEEQGFITGKIIANGTETIIPLYYQVLDGFVIVFNT